MRRADGPRTHLCLREVYVPADGVIVCLDCGARRPLIRPKREAAPECPKCGEECWREDVDVGVGVIYGPWGCSCGWSENPEYDSSDGDAEAPDGWRVTPQGVLINLEREREESAAMLDDFLARFTRRASP